MLLRCESREPPRSLVGQTRSFGDIGSMCGLPESGHGVAIYEHTPLERWPVSHSVAGLPVSELLRSKSPRPRRANTERNARRCGRRRLYGVHHALISSAP